MIVRTTDAGIVREAIGTYAEGIVGLDIEEWVSNPANIALKNDEGDVALFERQWRLPSSVCGHYFFTSRGRKAIEVSSHFLKQIFTGPYYVDTIIGLTPLDNKAARWMNRQIGFTSYGEIETDTGLCELVLLRKQDWLQTEGNKNE